jgi:hypothetical protein
VAGAAPHPGHALAPPSGRPRPRTLPRSGRADGCAEPRGPAGRPPS